MLGIKENLTMMSAKESETIVEPKKKRSHGNDELCSSELGNFFFASEWQILSKSQQVAKAAPSTPSHYTSCRFSRSIERKIRAV